MSGIPKIIKAKIKRAIPKIKRFICCNGLGVNNKNPIMIRGIIGRILILEDNANPAEIHIKKKRLGVA
jgi:hypothetical protein